MSAVDTPAKGTFTMTQQVKYTIHLAMQMFVHMEQTIMMLLAQDMQAASSHVHMLLHLDSNTKPCAR